MGAGIMNVGIRELKARLSHYVRVAREGERILITDRGRPVAVLSPPPIEEIDDLPDALRRSLRTIGPRLDQFLPLSITQR